MTTPDQQARQMRQETARGQDVNMVKKAINQDKIESFISRNLELRRVAHLESPQAETGATSASSTLMR